MLHRLLVLGLTVVLTGCASGTRAGRGDEGHRISGSEARAVVVFRSDGSRAEWNELVSAATGADAVLVGENHSHPLGLASAAALWEDVLERSPRAALALEFFERDEQLALDDRLSGVTDAAAFEKAARRTPGNYPPGHRAMVEAALRYKRPVIAANAPRRYVRLARTDGYDRLRALNESQRALFRIPDALPTGRYREEFDTIMGGDDSHGDESAERRAERLDSVFRSQSLWDWTMGESVARNVELGNTPTMLVVGRFHVDHDGGLPQALRALRPGVKTVTISFEDSWGDTLPESERGRADYVIHVGPAAKRDR